MDAQGMGWLFMVNAGDGGLSTSSQSRRPARSSVVTRNMRTEHNHRVLVERPYFLCAWACFQLN